MKILVLRLSSLGDLILSTAVLEAISQQNKNAEIHWVTSLEYGTLLESHPLIHQVWCFDRKRSLISWIKFVRELEAQEFDVVFDLHRSLRTVIAKVVFKICSFFMFKEPVRWLSVKKEKLRQYGYFTFKKLWPKKLRPHSKIDLFLKPISQYYQEKAFGRPNLQHLTQNQSPLIHHENYYCVMPSSLWQAKQWSVDSYVKVITELKGSYPVILGTKKDLASLKLVEKLKTHQIDHFNAIDQWSIPKTAVALSGAKFYLGGDTGLSHLAESVGTRSIVLFGPTATDQGFGPWKKESLSVSSSLWCRPCGKDGRYCFRLNQKYLCQKKINPDLVIRKIHAHLPDHR